MERISKEKKISKVSKSKTKRTIVYLTDTDTDTEYVSKSKTKRKIVDLTDTDTDTENDPPIKKSKKTESANDGSNSTNNLHLRLWSHEEWLADSNRISVNVSKNLIKLFENENSIPFIARYRRDLTNNLTAEELRNIKESYDILKLLNKKVDSIIKTLKTQGNVDENVKRALFNARTLDELEHIYAPYKPGAKKSLAERAKEMGLENVALNYLNGKTMENLNGVAKEKKLKVDDAKNGIVNLISHVISHDTECLENIRKWRLEARDIYLQTKSVKKAKENNKIDANDKRNNEKFEIYFNFKTNIKFIKPHQVLAINRGEKLKILSVKILVPERIFNLFFNFCKRRWLFNNMKYSERTNILEESFRNAYSKYLEPLIIRQTRSDLKLAAEKASIMAFENNLKNMLLARPCKNRILGIDPGFKHGCKYALISETGVVLSTGIFYPKLKTNLEKDESSNEIVNLVKNHNCLIIALGNGKACRETEEWITTLKNSNCLPADITYTIVNESGASIYSCTAEAKKEFPDFDTNIISAVSIARRLQDPLSELIKIEPKHLGVGMYQHDMKEKSLSESLDEIIMECVSFVGVNLNTASINLLRRIAGLNVVRATNIVKYREKIGFFKNRSQVKDVKGIGDKIFEQCIGFLRVAPLTMNDEHTFYKSKDTNRLDRTWIHPESYDVAVKLLKHCQLTADDVGTENCINKIKTLINEQNLCNLANKLNTTDNVLKLICESLTKPIDYDLRQELNQQPLFKKGCSNINDLKIGDILTGRVENVTDFGSFVDIGVGRSGLIHNSKTQGISLNLGDHVEVQVENVDVNRGRIGLLLKSVLQTSSGR